MSSQHCSTRNVALILVCVALACHLIGERSAPLSLLVTTAKRDNALPSVVLGNNSTTSDSESVIRNGKDDNILGFAIIGFPKCGTSSLANMLDSHPNLASLGGESYFNMIDQPDRLKKRLRIILKNGQKNGTSVVGYKQSHDLYRASITARNFAHVFPTSPLIVALRHPVHWFESYWNFRHNNNGKNWTMPFYPLKHVIQRRGDLRQGIWTGDLHVGMGMFHHFLSQLGKTPQRNGTREMSLLQYHMEPGEAEKVYPIPWKVPNRVFVVLTEQLDDSTSNKRLRRDLQAFLRLDTPFDEVPHVRPDNLYLPQELVARSKKENICKPKYKELREKLVKIGSIVSEWLLDYFFPSDGVYYSGDLSVYTKDWATDPCDRK